MPTDEKEKPLAAAPAGAPKITTVASLAAAAAAAAAAATAASAAPVQRPEAQRPGQQSQAWQTWLSNKQVQMGHHTPAARNNTQPQQAHGSGQPVGRPGEAVAPARPGERWPTQQGARALASAAARGAAPGAVHANRPTTSDGRVGAGDPLSTTAPHAAGGGGGGGGATGGGAHHADGSGDSQDEDDQHGSKDGTQNKKGGGRLRVQFTDVQTQELERAYAVCFRPSRKNYENLARRLGLEKQQVTIWFQNHRQRGHRKPDGKAFRTSRDNATRAFERRDLPTPERSIPAHFLPQGKGSGHIPGQGRQGGHFVAQRRTVTTPGKQTDAAPHPLFQPNLDASQKDNPASEGMESAPNEFSVLELSQRRKREMVLAFSHHHSQPAPISAVRFVLAQDESIREAKNDTKKNKQQQQQQQQQQHTDKDEDPPRKKPRKLSGLRCPTGLQEALSKAGTLYQAGPSLVPDVAATRGWVQAHMHANIASTTMPLAVPRPAPAPAPAQAAGAGAAAVPAPGTVGPVPPVAGALPMPSPRLVLSGPRPRRTMMKKAHSKAKPHDLPTGATQVMPQSI